MNGEMTLRDWLEAEPFTLVMSSGFFSFFLKNRKTKFF